MGLPESSLKLFSCSSHIKILCHSPCCVKLCGEDNHCNCNIGTHEYDSEKKEDTYK